MHLKNFDTWNIKKKELDALVPRSQNKEKVFFHEREVWWAHVGENIGFEICGKGKLSTRPVLVIKKFSLDSALVIPLSTKNAKNKYTILLGCIGGKNCYANTSQLRLTDTRRFLNRIELCPKESFKIVQKKLREFFS